MTNKSDGQQSSVKVAHLLTKELHEILINTIQPDIQHRNIQLHYGTAIVIQSKDEFRLAVVPCKSTIGSFTNVFRHIICLNHVVLELSI
mmetsp:Transcript_28632/g.42517  ORF Transcript_28632/g.42517 Transcript_28632/m.42517 type:complete len:89 (+) Transcript_28632:432-698(+)